MTSVGCGVRIRRERGFTLIELLVVIAIIAILVALLLPAVQQVREAARKSQCQDHMHNLGLAIHNYESSYKRFPSSGESTDQRTAVRKFFPISFFTAVLPYVEQKTVYDRMNLNLHYTNAANQAACKTQIDVYLCPTSTQEVDTLSYGVSDYMPIAYVDIDPTTGLRNPSSGGMLNADRAGGLGFCRRIAELTDGVSNVALIIEDGMKPSQIAGKYDQAPGSSIWLGNGGNGIDMTQLFSTANAVPGTFGGTYGAPNRWADPDIGSGVSGPPNLGSTETKIINNNATPKGGPAACPWSTNNCGPNDEPFSGHPGGAQVVLGDGKVTFLSENIDRHVIRKLCDPSDGQPVGNF